MRQNRCFSWLFLFSGFKDLHNELRDKHIQILVGMDIDKKIIDKVSILKDLDLDPHTVNAQISSRSGAKEDYVENYSAMYPPPIIAII